METNDLVTIHKPTLAVMIGGILDAATEQIQATSKGWSEQREKDSVRVVKIMRELEDSKNEINSLKAANVDSARLNDRLLIDLQKKENELKEYRRNKRKGH